jgi:hypothetical protein
MKVTDLPAGGTNFLSHISSTYSVQALRVFDSPGHTHGHTHTHAVGFLWTRDRPVTETITVQNTFTRHTCMTPAGFELAIPAADLPQTKALDCTATGIGTQPIKDEKIEMWFHFRVPVWCSPCSCDSHTSKIRVGVYFSK